MSRIRSAIGRSAGSSDAIGSGGGAASAGVTVAVVSAGVVAAGWAGVVAAGSAGVVAVVSAGAVAGVVSVELPIPSVTDGVTASDAVGGASVAVSGIGTADSIAAGVWVVA